MANKNTLWGNVPLAPLSPGVNFALDAADMMRRNDWENHLVHPFEYTKPWINYGDTSQWDYGEIAVPALALAQLHGLVSPERAEEILGEWDTNKRNSPTFPGEYTEEDEQEYQQNLQDELNRRPENQVPGGIGRYPFTQNGSALDDFLPVTKATKNTRKNKKTTNSARPFRINEYPSTAAITNGALNIMLQSPAVLPKARKPISGSALDDFEAPPAPTFSNDELAVYDWQTGKPKLDIFGYQIRSADPRDHIGDPRWGANGQGLTPEQAEELDWYYRN